jgi:LuxR family maltose regulon positive regulatory protein
LETSLLKTKLLIPPLRQPLVARPRLIQRLQVAINNNLTLISAPAGFGKTTLLTDWLHQNKSPILAAWVSLDEDENDPVRFWEYLIAALKTLQPGIGERALSLLHSDHPPALMSTLTNLINDITPIPEDFVLVLDDYHFINSQPVHTGITFLLEHLPSRMHLVIATRKDPPLPLANFRGKGTMLEIRVDDLRFTVDETVGLFRELNIPALSAENINTLNAKSEGWIVGLKMAMLSMRGEKDIPGFISSFTGSQRYIIDYLIEEVLKKQPDEVQDFLLRTSVLERLSGPLCDTVTGRNDSLEKLANLERDNLFIVPLDESRQWYRYEHLFTDLLRHRLETKNGAEEVAELHRRASWWYEDNQFPEEAIRHALAAQDWEKAMKLIAYPFMGMPRWGTVTTLNWLRSVPEEILRADTELYLNYSWALMLVGQHDAARTCLKYLDQIAEENKHLQGKIAAERAYVARVSGDIAHVEEHARKALMLLPADDIEARSKISLVLGISLMNRSLYIEAEPPLTEAYKAFGRMGNRFNTIVPLSFLGSITMVKGKLHQAVKMYQQAIGIDKQNPATAYTHVCLSIIYYEWNDIEKSAFHLEQALEMNRLWGQPETLEGVYLYLARTRLAQGDIEGAAEALEKADRLLEEIDFYPIMRARVAAYHVMFALAQEDTESISEWVNKLAEHAAYVPPDVPSCATRLLLSRLEKDVRAKMLQGLYERFAQAGLNYAVIGMRLQQALDTPALDPALNFLAEALTLAKPEGCIRAFVDEGMPLGPLLKQAFSRGIEPEYAHRLVAIIEAEERQRQTRKREAIASSRKPRLLSERELEVLLLLADGLSNRKIADRLFISLSTAKTHIHNIMEKLEASSRTQAIARARELNLI